MVHFAARRLRDGRRGRRQLVEDAWTPPSCAQFDPAPRQPDGDEGVEVGTGAVAVQSDPASRLGGVQRQIRSAKYFQEGLASFAGASTPGQWTGLEGRHLSIIIRDRHKYNV